ncbi:MAG: M20/M25/M40 family metallo-hydrolase [Armatimonadota bacterium]|nr:M20/M25/M40 family metallo-hydrolase [Armatimonadota bacterium]MDR7439536.1 M20/M25/M40 family metallo-hydrolase [Armatimonadota bacterium]MDR7443228.1 M20/M25/M40 family metallo-hydrolase [Armatimonadota bacterium]MDR7563454.1 M20/M25/M40 family metallo-hydrolase [Armatimonadota bacterium]MDR7567499.1 M20/M25/M40 family metallo-hydrolase [Armatimonadota bacterium]
MPWEFLAIRYGIIGSMEPLLERARWELLRLVSIPSPTGREQALLAYLEARLESLGLRPFRQPVEGDRDNLIWKGAERPRLLLTAHADTIPIEEPPDRPRVEAGCVWGRGSVDVKAGIAAILLALERTPEIRELPVAVAFTVDEEQGGLGSKVLPEAVQAEAAIVLEPTELRICPVEAGSLEVRIELSGIPAHGGEFEAGRNAILQAAELLRAFEAMAFVRAEHPLVGHGGFNVMEIRGGKLALVVPDRCTLSVDFRILPGQDLEAVKQEVLRVVAEHGGNAEVLDESPPFELSEDAPVLSLLREAYEQALGRPAEIGAIRSWTDAENLISAGIPSVVFGPGRLAVAHTASEHVELRQVAEAARVLTQAVRLACRP